MHDTVAAYVKREGHPVPAATNTPLHEANPTPYGAILHSASTCAGACLTASAAEVDAGRQWALNCICSSHNGGNTCTGW